MTGTLLPNKNLYALDLHTDQVFAVHTLPNMLTWHRRLGHANFHEITQIAHNGMVKGMPQTFPSKAPKCDHCILGKQARMPVPKEMVGGSRHRAMRRLGKIWVDLTEKAATVSCTGNYYIMNIVNNYSNKPWSIPLKSKDDRFAKLQAWILAHKNVTCERLGVLQTG